MQIELPELISLPQYLLNDTFTLSQNDLIFYIKLQWLISTLVIINLYFKKEANRFVDCDNEIRDACTNVINNLGISDVNIMVSNSVNQKLGPTILY